MTVEQVINQTKEILKNIHVPVWLTEQIALPINAAVSNLDLCTDAFERKRANNAAPQEQTLHEDEIEAAIEEIGPTDDES